MSKIGVQSQSGTILAFNELMARKPIAYLLLGNAVGLTLARDIRRLSPHSLLLIRAQADNWELTQSFTDDFIDRSLRTADPFQREGLIDFLLPPNEPIVFNDVAARNLNGLMVSVANAYKAAGYRTGAYNFSVGNPDYPLWQYLQDGIVASDGWLFLHEYGAPDLYRQSEDLALRHRKVLPLLSPAVRSILKIGITECGIDLGIGRPPDGEPTAGGYRNLRKQGDSDDYWINNFLPQMTWWDAELAKDDYVKFCTMFGFAMETPWNALGFDPAMFDNDRAKFIAWLGSGVAPIPPTIPEPEPEPDPMSDALLRLKRAWNSIGVPFNPDAAFFKQAQALKLGYPVGPEYINVSGKSGQGFAVAFLEGDATDVLGAKAYDWLTGAPYVPPVPPSNGGGGGNTLPPFVVPPALISIGANATPGQVPAGNTLYRLTGASVRQGVSAFCRVVVIGVNRLPAVGVQVVNVFPDGNGEILVSDGSGAVQFNYAASSAFSPPAPGPFTVFCAEGAHKDSDAIPKRVTWQRKISDTVTSLGDPHGEHTEANIQFAGYAT